MVLDNKRRLEEFLQKTREHFKQSLVEVENLQWEACGPTFSEVKEERDNNHT